MVLLVLVAGLATFASSYNATIDRSFQDRGRYGAGSDILVSSIPFRLSGSPDVLVGAFEEQAEVAHAAAGYRSPARRGTQSACQLLAVDSTDIQTAVGPRAFS